MDLLSLFIGTAHAQAGPAAQPSPWTGLLLPVLLIVVFYFLLIRPQQKKQKDHKQMVDALATGDEIVTGGGILGKVIEVGEQFVTVEVADSVQLKIQKHTIGAVLPKGTLKSA